MVRTWRKQYLGKFRKYICSVRLPLSISLDMRSQLIEPEHLPISTVNVIAELYGFYSETDKTSINGKICVSM
jgi:hypothetical protein